MHLTRFLLKTMATTTPKEQMVGMHWFRKGLRLSDNPSLVYAASQCHQLIPLYIMDGDSYQLRHCTALRANFLVECLHDLNQQLHAKYDSRLVVTSGDPVEVLPQLWKEFGINYLAFEQDESGEPYATKRDERIVKLAAEHGVKIHSVASETLHPLQNYVETSNNKVPTTMGAFQKVFAHMGAVREPLAVPESIPKLPNHSQLLNDPQYDPPKSPTELPWPRNSPKSQVTPIWNAQDCQNLSPIVHGGETLALQQLHKTVTARPNYVATFEKPKTSPIATSQPSTTVLSPYMSWGCLSPRTVWKAIVEAQERSPKTPTKPPVSLQGQVLWRDFNNLIAHSAGDSWGRMEGNPYCRLIPWDENEELLDAWKQGRTGYPWIDACMKQLEKEGWIHHLGRHAVACFLTRGDLWQSWEQGALHFESHLLDADHALNGFNWLWLSCSGFFYQYFRCYSPIAFQKKNDPSGQYIRKYLPVLAKLPNKYIYEPWKAPIAVQKTAGVRIGVDYPKPIVDHAAVSKENMSKVAAAYDAFKAQKESKKEKASASSKRSGSSKGGGAAKKKHKQTKI